MINKLFRGELEPSKFDYRTDPSYTKAMEDLLTAEERLTALLDETGQHSFSALSDAYARLSGAMTERAFHDGFCTAMELIFAVLSSRR